MVIGLVTTMPVMMVVSSDCRGSGGKVAFSGLVAVVGRGGNGGCDGRERPKQGKHLCDVGVIRDCYLEGRG